jgi:hypothetical protein
LCAISHSPTNRNLLLYCTGRGPYGGHMQRRHFITLLGGTVMVWPLTIHAQQAERVRRIGVLIPFTADDPEAQARTALFEQSLRQLGVDGWPKPADRRTLAGRRGRFHPPCRDGTSCARAGRSSGCWHRDRWFATASDPDHPSRIREYGRPGRRRLRSKPSAAGGQRHRFHEFRI